MGSGGTGARLWGQRLNLLVGTWGAPGTKFECCFSHPFISTQLATMDLTDIAEERPSKRIRLESTEEPILFTTSTKASKEESLQLEKELNAGITCYVSADTPGFSGILKQR